MSIPCKKLKTNHGEAVESLQGDPEYGSTSSNTKRKSVRKPMNLLDLDSDCLRMIFNLKRVSVPDLAFVAQTCTRLKVIATDIFVRAHQFCNLNGMEPVVDAVMVDRVLNTFGSSILDLRIDFTPCAFDAVKIIDSILRNCTKLQSLTMKSYNIPDCRDVFTKLSLLFGKLNSLHIENVWIDDDFPLYRAVTPKGNVINLFRDCCQLADFTIVKCSDLDRAIFESNFPRLEHFRYDNDVEHTVKGVGGFVFRHSNLKTLIVRANMKSASAIEIITANCTKLKQLEFASIREPQKKYRKTLRQLGRLENLAKLKICWSDLNVVGLLKEFQRSKSLKVLELEETLCDLQLMPTIAQIKTLRVLKLDYIENLQNLQALRDLIQLVELFINVRIQHQLNVDLADIIRHLVNLKKFKFNVSGYQDRYCISRNVYGQLVNIVENRPEVTNRYLEIDCRNSGDFGDFLRPTVEFKTLK